MHPIALFSGILTTILTYTAMVGSTKIYEYTGSIVIATIYFGFVMFSLYLSIKLIHAYIDNMYK